MPPSLRGAVGKHTLRRNLDTSDLSEALRLRPLAMAAFAQQIEDAKNRAAGRVDRIAEAAADWRRFAASAIDEAGHRLDAETASELIVAEVAKIEQAHGPDAASRFDAIVRADRFSSLDAHFTAFQQDTHVTPKTKLEQRTAIKRLIAWDDKLSLETLDRQIASRYRREGLTFTDSPATKNKQLTCLSSYWRWMKSNGLIDHNPWREQFFSVKGRSGQGGKSQPERPFTDKELAKLLTGPAEARLKDCMLIAALSGLRLNEICMLHVADCADGLFNIRVAKSDSRCAQGADPLGSQGAGGGPMPAQGARGVSDPRAWPNPFFRQHPAAWRSTRQAVCSLSHRRRC